MLSLFFEFLLVYSFQSFGLTDRNVWITTFQIPATDWFFTLSISPLFHLLPITVIFVLVSSWTYLTRYTAFMPTRTEAAKRPLPSTRREQEKRRFRALRQFSKSIEKSLQRISRAVKAGFRRIRGVSYVSRRLYFARAAVRSGFAVLLVFISLSLVVYVVLYPDLIRRGVIGMYMGNPSFLGFVRGTIDLAQGVGEALPPLGELGNAFHNAVVGAAPGFRNGLEQAVGSFIGPVVGLDVVGKYVLSQNVAAWASALVALVYGTYVSSRRPRRR